MVHAQYDRTATQKQQSLEKCMGKEVKNARRIGPYTTAYEHESQLADGGIGHHPLDVRLGEGNGGRKKRRKCTHHGNDAKSCGGKGKQRITAGDQKDPRRDHSGRVNEGAHRRRTFHGIGQPHMQGQLGRLARCAAKKQQADKGGRVNAYATNGIAQALQQSRTGKNIIIMQAAEKREYAEQAEQKAKIAEPVDNESFFPRIRCRGFFVIKADEQIG